MNGLHDSMNLEHYTSTGTGKNGLRTYFSGPETVSVGMF